MAGPLFFLGKMRVCKLLPEVLIRVHTDPREGVWHELGEEWPLTAGYST